MGVKVSDFPINQEFPMAGMSPEIALQLYTVRDVLSDPHNLERNLAEIAHMGYQSVELAGNYGKSAEELSRLLSVQGIKAISTHEVLDLLEKDVKAAIGRARTFGYEYIAVPWLGPEHRSPEGYAAIADRLRRMADSLKPEGITLLWHNHNFEFEKLPNGELPEDLLAASGVGLELDVYWVWYAGYRPDEWLQKYSGRVPILHMKDMKKDARDFAEVGTGVIDLPLYAKEASQHGVRYLVVEQDASWTGSPMESARLSYQNLKKMLA
jgi:sugar phosphate isomerase/epimerase